MARSDTDLHLLRNDVELTTTTMFIRLRKAKGKAVSPSQKRISIPIRGIPGLSELISIWQRVQQLSFDDARRTMPADVSFWRLASDTAAWTSSSAVLDGWLHSACAFLNVRAPDGEKWTSHSFRKGAASAAHAIGVSLTNICWHGGWTAKSSAVHTYITPVPSDAAAYRFFGWLLPQPPPGV
jgi:hypothetical protein